jgi:hypothetical protein
VASRCLADAFPRIGSLGPSEGFLITQLSRLAEYREALITAAVTGEIDVEAFDNDRNMEEATA